MIIVLLYVLHLTASLRLMDNDAYDSVVYDDVMVSQDLLKEATVLSSAYEYLQDLTEIIYAQLPQ